MTDHPLGLTKLEATGRAHRLADRNAQAVVVIQPADPTLPYGFSLSTFATWEEAVRKGRRLVPVLLITRNQQELDIKEDNPTVKSLQDLIAHAPPVTEEPVPEGMRRCPDCKEIKPLDRFGPHGHNPRCYNCQAKLARSYITDESRAKIAAATTARFKAAARIKSAAERTEPAPPEPEPVVPEPAPEPVVVIAQKQQQPRVRTNELRRRIDELAEAGGWNLSHQSGFWRILAERAGINSSTVHAAYDGKNVWSTTYFHLTKAIDVWLDELQPQPPEKWQPIQKFYDERTLLPLQIDGLPVPGPRLTLPTMLPDPDPEPDPVPTVRENHSAPALADWRQREAHRLLTRLRGRLPATGDVAHITDTLELVIDLLAEEKENA